MNGDDGKNERDVNSLGHGTSTKVRRSGRGPVTEKDVFIVADSASLSTSSSASANSYDCDVWLSQTAMKSISIWSLDFVLLKGSQNKKMICSVRAIEDAECRKDRILMSSSIRRNLGVNIEDEVSYEYPIAVERGSKVVVTPILEELSTQTKDTLLNEYIGPFFKRKNFVVHQGNIFTAPSIHGGKSTDFEITRTIPGPFCQVGPGVIYAIELAQPQIQAPAMALPIPAAIPQPPSRPGPRPAAKWLSQVIFKRNPYFPQMGDDLVYLRQAHELYAKASNSLKLKQKRNSNSSWSRSRLTPNLQNPMDLPYVQIPTLKAAEAVTVIGVEFNIYSNPKKGRFVRLQLELTDWGTGARTGQVFTVKYKDIDGVSDFLVLRQIYDRSLNCRWNASDKFRFMDPSRNSWVVGTVLKKQVHQAKFPKSNFQTYRVQWDGTKYRRALSPWDMETIPPDFVAQIPPNPYKGVPATEIDVNLSKNGAYEIALEDWLPGRGQEMECARISRLISQVISLPLANEFQDSYEGYARKVAYPVDLHVIQARLNQLFYRRPAAILTDVESICVSAAKLFSATAATTQNAYLITELLKEILATPDIVDISDCASVLTPIYSATNSSEEDDGEDEDASEWESEAESRDEYDAYRPSVSANVTSYSPKTATAVPQKKSLKRSIQQTGVGIGGGRPPATGSVKKPHRYRPGEHMFLGYPDKDLDLDDDSDDPDYIP